MTIISAKKVDIQEDTLVTVVIPGYKSKYIVETIDSVLSQTYKNLEIIVVDDGSPNNLKIVLADLITSEKIRYIYQQNQKMAAARNNAIHHAKGKFVAFIDDDDLWLPEKIEKQLKCFEDDNVGLVYTFAEGFNQEKSVSIKNFEIIHRGNIYCDIFMQDFIANSSVMVRKSCFDQIGVFNSSPEYFGVDDCDMWTRITHRFAADVIPEKLTKIRLHSEQFSGDRNIMQENDLKVRSQLMQQLHLPSRYRRKYFQRVYFDIGFGLRKTDKKKAASYYLKSFFSSPSVKSILAVLKLPLT
ncbi:glycosyltransferase family 2 protein [Paraglaciecola sp.]|uniref:glycosyltransferase family 2 protein n=1 Tax=Paraglaciecola sp. TaxID=1920173 RepID=UPI00273ECB92|nr:glycosyltransferase family 2 protein [Paraglaciecola sp.]MDP5030986.1 glycosyltransferase [Paraglaciecola sp.]